MSLPISLHGNEYLEHLRNFRDLAFDESSWLGKRNRIGHFIFGIAHAHWQTEEGGTAHLTEEGLRYKNTNITRIMPTTLRLYNAPGETGIELITFRMDLDDIGCIDIFRNLITSGTFREVAKAEMYKRADKKHGLSEPTDEQRELLYTEMERGATGLYTAGHSYDPAE
jgi:hypothetical protein